MHGQLSGDELDNRILDFRNRKYDILIATTVIENGVNFVHANTILIIDAHDFGLAQLHQLRGRVGRRDIEGYCYLVYRREEMADDGKKRLLALVNNSHLGAGFEIAMQDLQIRGAGDILGVRQSGKSNDTGLTLYFELLEAKIDELRTGEKSNTTDCRIELPLSFSISDDFFGSEMDKLHFFRHIESIADEEDLEYAYTSLVGSHEQVPPEAENLFLVLRVRLRLREYGVIRVKRVLDNYFVEFVPGNPIERLRAFLDRDIRTVAIVVTPEKVRFCTDDFTDDIALLRYLAGEALPHRIEPGERRVVKLRKKKIG